MLAQNVIAAYFHFCHFLDSFFRPLFCWLSICHPRYGAFVPLNLFLSRLTINKGIRTHSKWLRISNLPFHFPFFSVVFYSQVGSANTTVLQLFGPSIQPRHCLISWLEGVCTVTPLHADALTFVNGHHIQQPTVLHVSTFVWAVYTWKSCWFSSLLLSFLLLYSHIKVSIDRSFGHYRYVVWYALCTKRLRSLSIIIMWSSSFFFASFLMFATLVSIINRMPCLCRRVTFFDNRKMLKNCSFKENLIGLSPIVFRLSNDSHRDYWQFTRAFMLSFHIQRYFSVLTHT